LRQLSDAELLKRIQEEEENLSHLKFQKVIGQLENPMKLGHVRKVIARIKTILRDRQLKPINARNLHNQRRKTGKLEQPK